MYLKTGFDKSCLYIQISLRYLVVEIGSSLTIIEYYRYNVINIPILIKLKFSYNSYLYNMMFNEFG